MVSAQSYEQIRGSGTTVGTTPLILISWPIPSGRSVSAEVIATGRDTTSGDTVSRKVMTSAKNVTGVAALIGALATLLSSSDLALATASVAVSGSGGSLVVTVTGVLTKTIDWEVVARVQIC